MGLVMAYAYIIWLSCFVALPFVALWLFFGHTLCRHTKTIALAPLGALVFSVPWDIISVREHIWDFRTPFLMGVWLFGLPVEEYLFIILVTLLFATICALLWKRFGHPL